METRTFEQIRSLFARQTSHASDIVMKQRCSRNARSCSRGTGLDENGCMELVSAIACTLHVMFVLMDA